MTKRETKALEFATHAHEGMTDKAGAPYIGHPVRVAARLEGETDKVVALLHDVVEDCGVSLETLAREFGVVVADAVDVLSRHPDETYRESIERVVEAGGVARRVAWQAFQNWQPPCKSSKSGRCGGVFPDGYRLCFGTDPAVWL